MSPRLPTVRAIFAAWDPRPGTEKEPGTVMISLAVTHAGIEPDFALSEKP
jgi:hypothetical protein